MDAQRRAQHRPRAAVRRCIPFFLAVFIFFIHGHDLKAATGRDFALRVASTYGLTLVICALLLLGIDRLDFSEPLVALKRTSLVALPGSFAVTVVDSLGKPRGEEERLKARARGLSGRGGRECCY